MEGETPFRAIPPLEQRTGRGIAAREHEGIGRAICVTERNCCVVHLAIIAELRFERGHHQVRRIRTERSARRTRAREGEQKSREESQTAS